MASSSLTFRLFGTDVSASSTLRGVGRTASFTAEKLHLLQVTKWTSIVQGAASAASAVAQLAPAVGLLAPAALAGAAAFGTLKLASDQIKKSFSALTPALNQLKQVAGSNIAPGLTDLVNALKTDIPTVSAGVGSIAEQFSGIASYAASAFSGPLFRGDLATILDRTSQIVANLGGFVVDVGRAFISVGATAAPILGDLSNGLNDVVVRMQQWLFTATKSGQLTQLIQNAVHGFAQLGTVIGNLAVGVGSIFSTISGTGGNVLDVLVQLSAGFRQLATSAPFLGAISTIFTAIHQAVGPLIPIVVQLVGTLASALAPVIAALLPLVSQVLQILGRELVALIPQLSPILTQLATAFGQGVLALAPLVPLVGQLIAGLAPLLPIVMQLAGSVVAALVPAFSALLTGLQPVWPVIVTLARTLGQQLGQVLKQIAPDLGRLITSVMQLLPPLLPLIPAFFKMFQALLPIIPPIVGIATAILTRLIPAIAPLIRAFVGLETHIWGAYAGAIRVAISWIQSLIGWLQRLPGWISNAAGAIGRFFSGLGGRIAGYFAGAGSWLYNAGWQIIAGLAHGIEQKFEDVKRFVSGIGGWIASHKGPISYDRKLLVPHGLALMAGLGEGIDTGFGGVQRKVSGIAPGIAAGVGSGGGSAGSGGGVTVVVNVAGNLLGEKDFATRVTPHIRDQLVRIGKTNGGRVGDGRVKW